jgi:hypothetical protein
MQILRRLFAIDYRSLRLYRALTGLLILVDVAYRVPVIEDLYSDVGVFPRWLWLATKPESRHISLFLFSGSPYWAGFIFALLAVAGLLLIFDAEVRLSSVLAFLLLLSVHNRNWHMVYGADNLLRIMILWSALLPATKGKLQDGEFVSVTSAGVWLQIAAVYISAGWLKSAEFWLWHPDSSFNALSAEYFSTWQGRWILFFSPWRNASFRMLAFALFTAFHLGISVLMDVGAFPVTDLVLLVLVLPGGFWNFLLERSGFSKDYLASVSRVLKQGRLVEGIAVLAMVISILLNVKTLSDDKFDPGKRFRFAATAFGFSQNWTLFAPRPMETSGWFLGVGIKADGKTKVDTINLRDTAPGFAEPLATSDLLPHRRWLEFLMFMAEDPGRGLRQPYADFLCRQWRRKKHEMLKRVDVFFMRKLALGPEQKIEPAVELLSSANCYND